MGCLAALGADVELSWLGPLSNTAEVQQWKELVCS